MARLSDHRNVVNSEAGVDGFSQFPGICLACDGWDYPKAACLSVRQYMMDCKHGVECDPSGGRHSTTSWILKARGSKASDGNYGTELPSGSERVGHGRLGSGDQISRHALGAVGLHDVVQFQLRGTLEALLGHGPLSQGKRKVGFRAVQRPGSRVSIRPTGQGTTPGTGLIHPPRATLRLPCPLSSLAATIGFPHRTGPHRPDTARCGEQRRARPACGHPRCLDRPVGRTCAQFRHCITLGK